MLWYRTCSFKKWSRKVSLRRGHLNKNKDVREPAMQAGRRRKHKCKGPEACVSLAS